MKKPIKLLFLWKKIVRLDCMKSLIFYCFWHTQKVHFISFSLIAMNRRFQVSVYLFIFELLGCNCITLDIQNEEDRMGESFWINYPSIWCTWVNVPCEFLCPAFGLVNRIHGYLLCLVLLMIWYSLLTEIEWYFFVFCGTLQGQPSWLCAWRVSGVCCVVTGVVPVFFVLSSLVPGMQWVLS